MMTRFKLSASVFCYKTVVAVTVWLICPAVSNALKVEQLTPLQMLETADLALVVKVTPGTQPWKADVVESIRVLDTQNAPNRLSFATFSMRDGDVPQFTPNQNYIIFLSGVKDGVYQTVGYGKQAIWPKTQLEWPFTEKHISSFEIAADAFRIMQHVLNEPNQEVQDDKLAESLKADNKLLTLLAAEFVAEQPKDHFLYTRNILSKAVEASDKINHQSISQNSGAIDAYTQSELSPEVGSLSTRVLKPIAETNSSLPLSASTTPDQQPKFKPSDTPLAPTAAETKSMPWPWIIGAILLLAVVGGILLKLRRK